MRTESEPCGSLPVEHFSVSASYCVHHQAWSATVHHYRQVTDDDVEVIASRTYPFGPFDEAAEVVGVLRAWLAVHVRPPA